jgi:BirA family biotin operon repressor/biotin-[acetyl-CoA-carboxylase] ligase
MNIIKLSAINSTNDYLKQLTATQQIENFTVVTAEHQTQGRGQMGAKWNTEPGKNLTFSLLVKDVLADSSHIFDLNVMVAVSIVQALTTFSIPGLSIKWPNDILAGNKKTGGILIENLFKPDGSILSIIGIGLNVNQSDFSSLPKATSLQIVKGMPFNKEEIMLAVAHKIKDNCLLLKKGSADFWQQYDKLLYKKNVPAAFEQNGQHFMGIILGVTSTGLLQIKREGDTIAEYAVKEVALLY